VVEPSGDRNVGAKIVFSLWIKWRCWRYWRRERVNSVEKWEKRGRDKISKKEKEKEKVKMKSIQHTTLGVLGCDTVTF
jgi:type VI protein secretion system component VasK